MKLPHLHKSSIVVALLAVTLLLLIEIPGRVISGSTGREPSFIFEHGWPWCYLRRETDDRDRPTPSALPDGTSIIPNIDFVIGLPLDVRSDLPYWGVPWLSPANWQFWQASSLGDSPLWEFSGPSAICDFAAAIIIVAMVMLAWEFRRRRRAGVLSFRIVDILAATTLLCVTLGWTVKLHREFRLERDFQQTQTLRNGSDSPAFMFPPEWSSVERVCIAPTWMQALLGMRCIPNFFWRIHAANVDVCHATSANIEAMSQLAYLRAIVLFDSCDQGQFRFSALRHLPQLRILGFPASAVADGRNVEEIAQLQQLTTIAFELKEDVDPKVVARLKAKLPNCEFVDFFDLR